MTELLSRAVSADLMDHCARADVQFMAQLDPVGFV